VDRVNTIEAQGLTREFKKGPRAVDAIDLHVKAGEICGFSTSMPCTCSRCS
jgi:ABC-type multidrug transport system ATPase subunit